jgi:hypothetical protein
MTENRIYKIDVGMLCDGVEIPYRLRDAGRNPSPWEMGVIRAYTTKPGAYRLFFMRVDSHREVNIFSRRVDSPIPPGQLHRIARQLRRREKMDALRKEFGRE